MEPALAAPAQYVSLRIVSVVVIFLSVDVVIHIAGKIHGNKMGFGTIFIMKKKNQ